MPGSPARIGSIGHNGRVAPTGKRAGARRAAAPRRGFDGTALLLCAGMTLCVIAWGFLVYAAIEFGVTARTGEAPAWAFMGLAAVGAMACLFFGLMLGSLLLEKLGSPKEPAERPEPSAPRPAGGKRAAR